jgi:hypothetical protein
MSVLDGPSPRRAFSDRAAPCPSMRSRVEAAAPVSWMPVVTLSAAWCAHLEPPRTAPSVDVRATRSALFARSDRW